MLTPTMIVQTPMVRECSAGLLKFGYVYFTMPRHNRGLVVSASFSNERVPFLPAPPGDVCGRVRRSAPGDRAT
jgi:hypothetical protein